jgi:hypothetical protein
MKNRIMLTFGALLLALCATAAPLGTAFLYQGRFTDGTNAISGEHDFTFALFDSPSGTNRLGFLEFIEVDVIDGLLNFVLDFGPNAFDGQARWLEISVRRNDSGDPYTRLTGRQQLFPAPYALLATSVPNGAITAGKLATGAVSSSNLAPLSVTSAALDAHLALGGPGKAEGILELFDGANSIIRLDAEDHRIRMLSPVGRDTAVLGGDTLLLNTGFSNNSTGVRLSANTGLGGFLSLNASNGFPRAYLSGTNTGGLLNLFAANGTNTIALDGVPGQMSFYRNTDGSRSIHLFDFGGGAVRLNGNGGQQRALLWGLNGGGNLQLNNAAGTNSITLDGALGRTTTKVLQITGGSDLSEQFDVGTQSEAIEPGMVVCIDPHNPGKLIMSTEAYDRTVAGIVSGAGGVSPGMLMGQQGTLADGKHPVALTGRAYCHTDASEGSIRPGDLLTTSGTPGHAMKVTDHAKAQGAIIGKAMTNLEAGKGLVLVLVSLQ